MQAEKTMISLVFDERETGLYEKCQAMTTPIPRSKQVLVLGDILILNHENQPIIVFERKSIRDLLASIKDGRYNEQSARLLSQYRPHQIIYIFEGLLTSHKADDRQKVYSCMVTLNMFKECSVFRTNSLAETAECIVSMAQKLNRNAVKEKKFLLPAEMNWNAVAVTSSSSSSSKKQDADGDVEMEIGSSTSFSQPNYPTLLKAVKHANVTPENVGEIMLCQIPYIHAVSAAAIMRHFGSIQNLLHCLATDPKCLDTISCEGKEGKKRKLSSLVKQNLFNYFFPQPARISNNCLDV
jgi:ERCC4-type nuclease